MTHPRPNYDDIEEAVVYAADERTLPAFIRLLNTATDAHAHTSEKGRVWIAAGVAVVMHVLPTVASVAIQTPEFVRFSVTYRDVFKSPMPLPRYDLGSLRDNLPAGETGA